MKLLATSVPAVSRERCSQQDTQTIEPWPRVGETIFVLLKRRDRHKGLCARVNSRALRLPESVKGPLTYNLGGSDLSRSEQLN